MENKTLSLSHVVMKDRSLGTSTSKGYPKAGKFSEILLEIVTALDLPLVPARYKHHDDQFLALKLTYASAQLCCQFSRFCYTSVLFIINIPE
jgi:hypothetical protein